MKRFFLLSALLSVLSLTGCVSVNYIGESYPPTKSVKIYMDKKEIPWKYQIIGKAIATAPDDFTCGDIEGRLRDKACSKGANAILILSFRKVECGENVQNTSCETFVGPGWGWGWGYDDYWDDDMMGPPYSEAVVWNPSANVSYDFETKIRAVFLRYITKNGKKIKIKKK
jgi:hypothetical protein